MAQPVILVTGSTDGIGKATAAELLSRGAGVIIHGKSEKAVQVAQRDLARRSGGERPDTVTADFSDMDQIRQMAADLSLRYSSMNVLINNAGTYQKTRRLTEQGIELTFAVNYLAPFLLTGLLLPLLRKGTPARIVTVASSAHEDVDHIDWNDLPAWYHYRAWDAYALSKFADITFTYVLARKIAGTGITANCLHPGVTNTHILKTSFPGVFRDLTGRRGTDIRLPCPFPPGYHDIGPVFRGEKSCSVLEADKEPDRAGAAVETGGGPDSKKGLT